MRRPVALAIAISLIAALLGFLTWWNCADFAWNYPLYKLRARNWSWRHFGDPFDQEAHRIAGFNAVDCSPGRISGTTVMSCASQALRERRGFRLRENYCGLDSCGATGLAGGKNGVYQVAFNLRNGMARVTRRLCPVPLNLEKKYGSILCVPESRPEEGWEVIRNDSTE